MKIKEIALSVPRLIKGIPVIPGNMRTDRCAGYAVRAAKLLYGIDYEKGNAWELAAKNRSAPVESEMREGCLLGIYKPDSRYNQPGREYTHIALYVGRGTILHNYLGNVRFESLADFLEKNNCTIAKRIEPKQGLGITRRQNVWLAYAREIRKKFGRKK